MQLIPINFLALALISKELQRAFKKIEIGRRCTTQQIERKQTMMKQRMGIFSNLNYQ